MAFNESSLDDYIDVPARIQEFYKRFPEGSLRPLNPAEPYRIESMDTPDGPRPFVVYAAAAYRTPDDQLPGVGVAWEPFPGRTSFTRNSELMNAETSAWGRALGSLGIGVGGKIASREEVRNRQAERDEEKSAPKTRAARADDKRPPARPAPYVAYDGSGPEHEMEPTSAQHIAEAALKATTSEEVRLQYMKARHTEQLDAIVTPPDGQDGEPMPLRAVLLSMKETLEAKAS